MDIDRPVTVNSSKLAIEESLRVIDEQKAELYELIRQLNSKRNKLAPISVLPPELLGRIFVFVIAEISNVEYFTLEWTASLNFTYVSQNWRNVALDTPGLWGTPTFLDPFWGKTMLERSKMADLVVDSRTSLIVNPLVKEVFDNHASRIREIKLCRLVSSFLSVILQNIQPSSLRLRSLHLSRDEWSVDDEPPPLFPAHLLVQPDSLRHLVIDRCAFDLYAQPRPLLTHLSVERPRDRPLLSEFITALSGMPALETLKMIHSLPLADKPVKSGLKVELPNLSSLHLSSMENVFEVLNVIDFLIVPWTARVKISSVESISHPSDTVIQLSDIVSPLSLFFSSMTGNVERRAYNRLRLYDPNGIGLSAWRNERPYDSISTDLPDLDLSLELVHLRYRSLDKILHCLSPFECQALIIDINYGQDAIHNFFGQSTAIQTVELQSGAIPSDFFQALTHKPEGYERLESSYYSVSFPVLQSLRFNRASFHVYAFRELLDCLMERYERGAALEKLSLWRCYNTGEMDIRLLREVVPDVEWDEIVLMDGYEYEYDDPPCELDIIDYEDSDVNFDIQTPSHNWQYPFKSSKIWNREQMKASRSTFKSFERFAAFNKRNC